MRKFIFIALLSIEFALGQIPNGYYDDANGLTGFTLKTKLCDIITQGHVDHGYSGIWNAYINYNTDIDHHYENDGTILDIYSENPTGEDPYTFIKGASQCGSGGTNNGHCYNREHIVPQSVFDHQEPMKNDIHFVRATDSSINSSRSNFPFGVVTNPTKITQNGSKIGYASNSGTYTGKVFEPIDEFKGDVARMIFYFVTRYENQIPSFESHGMINPSDKHLGLTQWELNTLLTWHNQDPVSPTEIDRNNASYNYQGNRNPFIDHPEFVNIIWNYTPDTENPTPPTDLIANNPTANSIDISWTEASDNIGVTAYEIYLDGELHSTVSGSTTSQTINGLTPNTTYQFYIKAKDAAGNSSEPSNVSSETTLEVSTGGGAGSCGTEDFENIPTGYSNTYTTRTWTNNGITWTAVNSRSDQSIYGKAITIRKDCSLSSSTISGGISSLTVTTQRKFSGTSGTFDLIINGNTVGTIPYNENQQTITINNINIEGDFTIEITNNSDTTKNRVAFDDLSWDCYTSLDTDEVNHPDDFYFYPNPVKNGIIYYQGKDAKSMKWIKIYTMSGQLVKTIQKPFGTKNYIYISELQQGHYLLQTPLKVVKIIVE
ncbi:MAG: endonuclease I [Flavobacteriales bacterium]|nr:MAG: endonuclease I [Flavobacteriales bacterium]